MVLRGILWPQASVALVPEQPSFDPGTARERSAPASRRRAEACRRDAPGNVAAGGVSGAALGAGVGCPATRFAPWTTKSATTRNVKSHQLARSALISRLAHASVGQLPDSGHHSDRGETRPFMQFLKPFDIGGKPWPCASRCGHRHVHRVLTTAQNRAQGNHQQVKENRSATPLGAEVSLPAEGR
jgi:hypothetical protein